MVVHMDVHGCGWSIKDADNDPAECFRFEGAVTIGRNIARA